ncbi:hypothetical protein EXN66_Car001058 [Channa argus]|uniref:Uncharacterized protein n=1 Tax=Channa argus TaxID=215402 RepID=A0A6G1QZD3_CHAAH|nr:hypothetical protein EXN66_Car001058 [Channa argus]
MSDALPDATLPNFDRHCTAVEGFGVMPRDTSTYSQGWGLNHSPCGPWTTVFCCINQ